MNSNLVLLKNNGAHKTFPLTGTVTVLGRRHDCDLKIPLPNVSRRHCQLSRNGDSTELRDLDSKVGTFVNDKRVDKQVSLKPGDYVRIGPLTFLYQVDGKPEKITWPKKAAPQPAKPGRPAAKPAEDELDDSFADLDVSDSFVDLGESDSGLEDLKDL
jgi:pSer/pThr/pTyr-binding forkhead associated (FHA) protein